LGTFVTCFTSYLGKSQGIMNNCLLFFLYLTLPICAGIGCQNTKQGPKTTKLCKDQLAMAIQRRAKWRVLPESTKNRATAFRHGEKNPARRIKAA